MSPKKIIVAGHTCLDVTPDLSAVPEGQFQELLQPGKLVYTGGFALSTGGAVPNTGLSLHRLGAKVQLIGKIGDDLFGTAVIEKISKEAPELVDHLVVDPGSATSITLILNPPGMDRSFLHYEGANATFYASDLPRAILKEADLFHFGYPSLMRSIYRAEGAELVLILQRARRAGLTTSLDFSLPDPTSPAGKVNWPEILANSLPLVDVFVPSAEELTFLLDRDTYDRMCADPDRGFLDGVTPKLCHALSERVLDYGVKVVLVKIGHRGIYMRTGESQVWGKVGRGLEGLGSEWINRELWAPALNVRVQATCGAGDAAIAGFLASLVRGADPESALRMATAAGALSVGGLDPFSDLVAWEDLHQRVMEGWPALPLDLGEWGWERDRENDLWKR